jgi:hypothetical protein
MKPKSDRKPGESPDKVQGEGNYEAARRYNDAAREHAKSADVEEEARDAQPTDEREERELQDAEDAGRARALEEDPLLDDPERIEHDPGKGR